MLRSGDCSLICFVAIYFCSLSCYDATGFLAVDCALERIHRRTWRGTRCVSPAAARVHGLHHHDAEQGKHRSLVQIRWTPWSWASLQRHRAVSHLPRHVLHGHQRKLAPRVVREGEDRQRRGHCRQALCCPGKCEGCTGSGHCGEVHVQPDPQSPRPRRAQHSHPKGKTHRTGQHRKRQSNPRFACCMCRSVCVCVCARVCVCACRAFLQEIVVMLNNA